MEEPLVPAREARITLRVANSRFVATGGPAFSVIEARDFIHKIETASQDATHHVPAYIIGHGNSVITHCNDDGEPTGTAGPPVLAVLQGSDLGDVVAVVTRYFGGTKLGTGGLVRAYTDATRELVDALPRAIKVPTCLIRLSIPYSLLEQVERLIELNRGLVMQRTFAGDVGVVARIPQETLSRVQGGLLQISRGAVEARIIETNQSTLLPVRTK